MSIFRFGAPLALVFAIFAIPSSGQAQTGRDSGCILDRCQDRDPAPQSSGSHTSGPQQAPAPDDRVFRRSTQPAGNFDFYVLALSWSPGFCAGAGGQKGRDECQTGARLGFVVHGLWPQFERGFPSDCDPSARPPSRTALDAASGLYPNEGLARYEWRKHGACSGLSPLDYFASVRTAREKVQIPSEFGRLKQQESVAPMDVARAFEQANPRLRPGMLSVGCQGGYLQEVRICLSKDLRDFRPCPEVSHGSCRAPEIKVPPSL